MTQKKYSSSYTEESHKSHVKRKGQVSASTVEPQILQFGNAFVVMLVFFSVPHPG